MRESIFYSALRALFVAFCAVIGICFGILATAILLGVLSSGTKDNQLTTVHTEEILPNANGKREVLSSEAPVILQINIDGIIGTEELSAHTVKQQLVESREGDYKNNRVKGLLLYINTPGGTVTDADGIYNAVIDYKKKYQVPVYAYVDGLCASGGMYIALAADKIFASEISLIGSVGVIAPTFMNVTKLLDKIGVEALTISAGKDKDAMNPLRPWKPGEEDNYKQIVDYYYSHFVNLVTSNRPDISKEKLIKDYGAHIFPANEALERGFIDVSGSSISATLKELLKTVGIEGDYYQVIRLENKGWWKNLFSSQASLMTGTIKHEMSVSPAVDLLLQNRYLYLYYPQ
ncbi:putative signal peptide peptidase sppA [Candidatus Protochlamydia naegleriophila]|uniref:Putative signal peptide peptidase sppA n=1 Tax=Candidatus Protochlamydia naegleriophila TaxID=389348 RepID=A0A0U5J714_9BACT|nr:S49 family peptidase [Candidatus Protochlamydia naegleriophila]CUI15865.1 putative signal peptide peptidase sppA [Candidatus Protochlamydia naegleriophila]